MYRSRYVSATHYSDIVPAQSISNVMMNGEDLAHIIKRYRTQIQNRKLDSPSLDLAYDWYDTMSLYINHLFTIQEHIESSLVQSINALADKKLYPIVVNCASIFVRVSILALPGGI